MLKQNQVLFPIIYKLSLLLIIPLLVLITSFSKMPKHNFTPVVAGPFTVSGYMPLYRMKPDVVEDIISGLPLDKRVIFQFVTNGSATSDVKVLWYKASGMENHGQNRTPEYLEIISGTTAIRFGETEDFILANNYLFVKTFKTYIRSLANADYEYVEFKPVKDASNNHVYFKIHAVFTGQKAKSAGYLVKDTDLNELIYVDEGIDSQPSPPAHTGN